MDVVLGDGTVQSFICEGSTLVLGTDIHVGGGVTATRCSTTWETLARQRWCLQRSTAILPSTIRPLSTVFVSSTDLSVDAALVAQLSFTLHGVVVAANSTLFVPCEPSRVLQMDVTNTMPALAGSTLGRIVAGRTNFVLVQAGQAQQANPVTTPVKGVAAGTPKGTASPWKSSPVLAAPTAPVTPPTKRVQPGQTVPEPVGSATSTIASPASLNHMQAPNSHDHGEVPPVMAGHEAVLQQLHDLLLSPFKYPQAAHGLQVRPPTGLLLYGPPGCGKTLLVRCLAHEAAQLAHSCGHTLPFSVFTVNGSEVMSPIPGESERRLRAVFQRAREYADKLASEARARKQHGLPLAVIFMDEIDAIAPKRATAGGRVGQGVSSVSAIRLVTQLLTLLDGAEAKPSIETSDDGMPTRGHVVVIGATNRPQDLDPALRRPGRLDREVRLDPPTPTQREAILRKYVQAMNVEPRVLQGSYLSELASAAIGFVGADLQSWCVTAQQIADKRGNAGGTSVITTHDIEAARLIVSASSLRGLQPVISTTRWSDVGGMDAVVTGLTEAVQAPLTHGQVYRAMGLAVPRGVLLYGPPGNSKTTLVRALACSVHASFFSLSSADVLSAYVGEAEATLREAFARARRAVPAILFLDEIDAIVGKRGIGSSASRDVSTGLLTTLLTEMDGVAAADGVLIVAATNRPDALDPALLRPGRLELHIHVPCPDEPGRLSILQVHTRQLSLHPSLDLATWAREDKTQGWSGAQLENLCREAAMCALRESLQGQKKSYAEERLMVREEHVQEAYARLARPPAGKR